MLNATLPDGWEIVNRADDGGYWQDSDTKWLFLPLGPGETREPTLTLSVPESATNGTVEIPSRVSDKNGTQDSAAATVTVENDSGDGSDGDDSDSDYDGSYGGGGDEDTGDSGSIDSDSGDTDTLYGDDDNTSSAPDNSSSDAKSNTTDAESNTTDAKSNTTAGDLDQMTASEPTDTAAGPASEPADESTTDDASDTETDDGSGASDTETGSNTSLGLVLSVLLLLAAGIGMVTVRRSVVEESIVESASWGSQTDPETAASGSSPTESETAASEGAGDGYGETDIEVLEFDTASEKCTITYATRKRSNKAIGDEVRKVARAYSSADEDEVGRQRLNATVRHGGRTVATWHIDSEWLEQFAGGELSAEAFERRAVATLSFSN